MSSATEAFVHEPASDRSRRRFTLHGGEVATWFTEREWTPLSPHLADAHAFIDELVTPILTARRIWHTPMTLTYAASSRSMTTPHPGLATTSHQVSAWLQADGDLTVTDPSGTGLALSAGFAYFHLQPPAVIASVQPTARVEVTFEHRVRDLTGFPVLGDCANSATWPALISVVNAILNASDMPDPHAFSLFVAAIESLAKALWSETTTHATTSTRDVLSDAMNLMELRATDPSFTVTTLAAHLGITRAHLTRVFREHGILPSRTLRHQRLIAAHRLLARDPHADLAAVAAASGFSSERALREALRGPHDTRRWR